MEETIRSTGQRAAALRDELTGALIGLARATEGRTPPESAACAVIGALSLPLDGDCGETALRQMLETVRREKNKLAPDCAICKSPCGRTADYDMKQLREAEPDVIALKLLLLFTIRGMARRAQENDVSDPALDGFLCEALFMLGYARNVEPLRETLQKAGRVLTFPIFENIL